MKIAANFCDYRKDLKKYLDEVEENNEIIILKRKTGNGAVVLSIEEYNQMLETMHLLKSKANADHLYASIQELKSGDLVEWQVNEQ